MEVSRSDSLVFFGATGDLAYKQIFPSLQGLIRDEGLADIHLDRIGNLLDYDQAAFSKG